MLRQRLGASILDGLAVTFAKTVVATAAMCVAGCAIIHFMASLPQSRTIDVVRLVVIVPSSAAVYVLAARLLKAEMLSLLTERRRG